MWFVGSSKLQSGFILELLLVWLLVCFFVFVVVVGGVFFFVLVVCQELPSRALSGGQRATHPRGAFLSVGSFFWQLGFFFLLSELDPPQAGVGPNVGGGVPYSLGGGSSFLPLVLVLQGYSCRNRWRQLLATLLEKEILS